MDGPDPGPSDRDDRVPDRGRPRRRGALARARWVLQTDHPTVAFARELAVSVLGVLLIGVLLFAVSGIWPPMVAVESGSMEPHMYRGDLVFVMDEHRLSPAYATGDTGVVTYRAAADLDDHWKFGNHGDVIVFAPNGGEATPIIHRAHFWVEEGEDWVASADPAYLPARECSALPNCPAPHAGFVTKGDDNGLYDQVAGISPPVRPEWIRGTAEVRIPWLGYVRLYFSDVRAGALVTSGGWEGFGVDRDGAVLGRAGSVAG